MPIELLYDLSLETQYKNEDAYVSEASEEMRKAFQVVRKQLKTNFERAKRRYDERVKSTKFCDGEFVSHFIPRTKKGLNKKWLMTNKGSYRIVTRLNDVNFVVQKVPNSSMEIVLIDRLMLFHGTVPKPWKQVLRKEQETASEKSASEDKACTSAENAEATRAKNAAALPERALANANNGDMHNVPDANATDGNSEETDTNVTNTDTDMTVDLIDFMDGIVELADCGGDDRIDNGDCLSTSHHVVDDSAVELETSFWSYASDDDCTGPE